MAKTYGDWSAFVEVTTQSVGAFTLTAEPGSFALTGNDAVLTWSGQTSALLGVGRFVGRQIQTAGRSNIQTAGRSNIQTNRR
jgi:hypothetical protein